MHVAVCNEITETESNLKMKDNNANCFNEIKKHLSRIRTAEVIYLEEKDDRIRFTISNQWTEKYFCIFYCAPGEELTTRLPRPRWHHYLVMFEQENVPSRDGCYLMDAWDEFWCIDEEDVIYGINKCRRRHRK